MTPFLISACCPLARDAAKFVCNKQVVVAELVTARATLAATVDVMIAVVSVVDVTLATLPDPVDPSHDATVPFDERNVFAVPIVVSPRALASVRNYQFHRSQLGVLFQNKKLLVFQKL